MSRIKIETELVWVNGKLSMGFPMFELGSVKKPDSSTVWSAEIHLLRNSSWNFLGHFMDEASAKKHVEAHVLSMLEAQRI